MHILKKLSVLLISSVFIFLPQNSYAGNSVPVSDGFDFPLGKPDGAGYGVECCGGLPWLGRYDYEGDGLKEYHPGEDWNGVKQDAGDPVYAVGDGLISFAKFADGDWGYLVLIEHKLKDGSRYWSQYAHLKGIRPEFKNRINTIVKRGDAIGWVGDYEHGSGKRYHLHFEIRKKYRRANEFVYDWSREKVEEYYVNPSEFIRANRPLPPLAGQKLTLVSASQGQVEVVWDECVETNFDKYELYRAEVAGGTADPSQRQLLLTVTDPKTLTFQDKGLYAGQNYYYGLVSYLGDGRTAISNEIVANMPREAINISNKAGIQTYVGASKGKVYWQDMTRESNNFPDRKTFYYYDLAEKAVKTIQIGDPFDNRIQGPDRPQIAGDWLCYNAKTSRYSVYSVYCRNLVAGNMSADIRISPNDGTDHRDPSLSEEGILIWRGGTGGRLLWTNLNSGTEIHELTTTTVHFPKIWGRNVIYQTQATSKTHDLWLASLDTGESVALKRGIDISPSDIWQNHVTFSRGNNIYLIDINNPDSEALISEASYSARVRDGKVVYAKLESDGGYHIYVYIIGSGKTYDVAGPLDYLPAPVIYENIVAYDASTNGTAVEMDIFLTNL